MTEPKIRFKRDDGSDFPNWDVDKLSNISDFITKGATPTTYGFQWQEKGIPFFRNDAIKENKFIYGDYSYISEEAHNALIRSEIKAKDILIAITGDIGKVGIIPNEITRGNINQHTARVRIIKSVPYFIYQYLCTTKVQSEYQKIKTGLSMPQLSLEQIRDTEIPLPSLPEQQKIADFLSDVDGVIAASEEEVANLEKQKKAVMQKIFSQEVRFKKEDGSDFPDWKEKTLGDIANYVTKTSTGLKTSYVGTENMLKDCAGVVFELYNNSEVKGIKYTNGDTLISNIRPYLKKAWYSDREGICSTDVLCIRAKDGIRSEYLYTLLSRDEFFSYVMQAAKGSKMPRGDKEYIMLMPISFAVDEREQQLIADFLTSYDEAITAAKQELEKWKELKKGLLQQMFV